MEKSIIADSSAFVSLYSTTDSNHKQAVLTAKLIGQSHKAILIPSEVLAETINVLGKKLGHKLAVAFAREVLQSTEYSVSESTESIRLTALEKFENQPSSVSFTDCLVMAFADEYETKEIFGFDDAFRKNGYIRFGIDKSKLPSPK
jgi:predicted nucleic acid-binding protein